MNDQPPNLVPLLVDVDGVLNVLGAGVEGILDRGLVPHDAAWVDPAIAATGSTDRRRHTVHGGCHRPQEVCLWT